MCIIFAHSKLDERFVRYIVDLLPKALSVLMFLVNYFFKSLHIRSLGYFLLWHFDSPNYNNDGILEGYSGSLHTPAHNTKSSMRSSSFGWVWGAGILGELGSKVPKSSMGTSSIWGGGYSGNSEKS